jgi:two-component system, NtrC family, response regulator AtoC
MTILIVEDEVPIRRPLKERLLREGYGVVEADDARAARSVLERVAPDLVLLDAGGLAELKGIRESAPDVPVIVVTESPSDAESARAIEQGAFGCVAKPVNLDELALTVKRALEATELRRVVALHAREHKARYGVENLIGRSKAMQDVRALVEKVARSQTVMVLARGESGTGKDLVAKAIHAESPRADRPFVNITCTALQDTLLESELFGHERGSFSDAKTLKKGLLEMAHGGTVLLDEIGDMSPALQGKLLRVLEEKTFRRVGGTQDIRVDVRIVACTHVNLEQLIAEKKFREDLYYRLNAITIDVPPLRERREDVGPIAERFLQLFSRDLTKQVSGVSPKALAKLQGYDWPGNVRELRNVIERAVLLGTSPTLCEDDLILGRPAPAHESGKRLLTLPTNGLDVVELDRDLVVQALERAGGNQTKAGQLLGLTRDKFHYRLQKYGLLAPEAAQ